MEKFIAIFVLLPCLFVCSSALDNGLGLLPPMGWNSWYNFTCHFNQSMIEQTVDAIIEKGLDKLGYTYVCLDDCWAKSRDENNVIQPDKDAFPDFQGMIDYVHSKGLKFGLYSDAGTKTCAGRPGSLGYEEIDANTYAKWKVDFLKYDNCNNNKIPSQKRYIAMRDALNKTGRPIFFSMCSWGTEDVATWALTVGNSWRTTGDIGYSYSNMVNRADLNDMVAKYSGPGGWNDPDMLQAGNHDMNNVEHQTQFSLWSLMKSPLLIGTDLRKIDNESLRILTNPEVIAVNQDKLAVQGTKRRRYGVELINEVWAGPLEGGAYAVVLVNRSFEVTSNVTANWSDFGLDPNKEANVRDLWQMKDLGKMKGSITATLPIHASAMYKITPVE